ncbi:MAG: RNA polymerase subunit sigma, partial [Rickettsiales bacterium]|nr:RNA polymerase subunit sigma [Rickettsiales bacterium]
ALNRTYAVYKLGGEEAAAKDAYKLNLYQNQYYYVLLAELHLQKDKQKSMNYLETAYDLAKTEPEKNLIHSKISQLAYAC